MKPNHLIYLNARSLFAAFLLLLSTVAYGDGSMPSADLASFSLSPNSIIAPSSGVTTIKAQWSASVNSSITYSVFAHIFPASVTSRIPTDANRIFNRNCSSIPLACDGLRIESCTLSSAYRLSCSVGNSVTLKAGTYSVIAQACVYDTAMNQICSSKETTLSIH